MELAARRVGIVGIGHVGSHCAYSLAIQGIVDELVLCDTNEEVLEAQAKDLTDSAQFFPHRVAVSTGPIEKLADCDIVVIAVAREIPKIALRDVELKNSVREVRNFLPRLMKAGFDGIIINITNPCDAITQIVWRESGLDSRRVIGTGTSLDSARFRSIFAREVDLNPNAINGFVLGEHGNAQFPAWSHVTVGLKPLVELEKDSFRFKDLDKEKIEEEVRSSGYKVWFVKHGVEFSVTSALADVVRNIYSDNKMPLPVSVMLDGQYGESGVYVSTPTILGRNGVEEILELKLPEDELKRFQASCESVRNNVRKAAEIAAGEK